MLRAWLPIAFVVGCSSTAPTGRATIETDVPTLPAKFVGSASASRNLDELTLTITNVTSGESMCAPADLIGTANVANLFTMQVRVRAFSPSGDLVTGTYTNATAAFTTTDSSCTSTVGEVATQATVGVDGSSDHLTGFMQVHFPGQIFIVTYDAPQCGLPTPLADASACTVLPACPTGGEGGASMCIDFP